MVRLAGLRWGYLRDLLLYSERIVYEVAREDKDDFTGLVGILNRGVK